MVKSIISAFPQVKKEVPKGQVVLNIAEMFTDTIQGEGIYSGVPSTFLRLQSCTLNCSYCDTTEVWRKGNPYSISEVLKLMEDNGVIDKLREGQHLVLTGGSPLLQQVGLVGLLESIKEKYRMKPFVEVENECVKMPIDSLIKNVTCWNNSPKLFSSGMDYDKRFKPNIIRYMSELHNSRFKFVISGLEDWKQIQEDYLTPNRIRKSQIILMPEGSTREELRKNYALVVDLATKYNVRVSDRVQVTIWDKTTGV